MPSDILQQKTKKETGLFSLNLCFALIFQKISVKELAFATDTGVSMEEKSKIQDAAELFFFHSCFD